MATLQERTNNPLNIRYSPANQWVGQVGNLNGFCVFASEAYGVRAAYRLLYNYIHHHGRNTPRKIIEAWAPPTENNTEAYIEYVCREAYLRPDDTMYIETIDDYWRLLSMMRAMCKMESGKYLEEQQINLYIAYPDIWTNENKIDPSKTPII